MPIPDIKVLQVGIYGDIKTCKTSLALSFPKPMVHLDLDLSFERALPMLDDNLNIEILEPHEQLTSKHMDSLDVIAVRYQVPMKVESDRTKLEGFLDLWEQRVVKDIAQAFRHPRIRTVNFDTGTMLWKLASAAQLERVQKKASEKTREQLIQIEYARPNNEMAELFNFAKHTRTNLVSLHHEGNQYGMGTELNAQGKSVTVSNTVIGKTWDGFKGMGRLVDIVGRCQLAVKCITCGNILLANEQGSHEPRHEIGATVPVFEIEACGLTLNMKNQVIPAPSFEVVLAMVNALRKIR